MRVFTHAFLFVFAEGFPAGLLSGVVRGDGAGDPFAFGEPFGDAFGFGEPFGDAFGFGEPFGDAGGDVFLLAW